MRRSDSIAALSKAITAFQKDAPPITKDKKASIPTKGGSNYEYKYADLATIWDKIRGILADNDIAIIQSPSSRTGEPTLTTMITHGSGEWIEDEMQLKITQDTPQGQGSAITYARRYMLCAMLGIVADSDNDAVDNRTLSGVQKKKLFDTARQVLPELGEDPISMVRFLSEVLGKHPSRILDSEYEDAVQSIESYTSSQVTE